MVQDKYYIIGKDCMTFKGYSEIKINSMLTNSKEREIQEFSLIAWKDIKDYIKKGSDKKDLGRTVKFCQTYNKELKCMMKGDIVLPVISPIENIEILYIDEEPEKIYLYDDTVFVIRAIEPDINSKYIYIMLNSQPIKNGIIKLKLERANINRGRLKSNRIIPRLTNDLLSTVMIIKSTQKERDEIVNQYEQLNKAQDDFNKKLCELQTQDKDKSAIIWFQNN